MSILNICGFETGGDEEGISLFASGSATAAIQSSVARTGTYALHISRASTDIAYFELGSPGATGLPLTFSINDEYARFYFRYATKPASASEEIVSVESNDANVSLQIKFQIRIDSAGKLSAWTNSGQIGSTGATVLAQDTWYRIEIHVGTGATAAWELKVNGVSEISGVDNLPSQNQNINLGIVTNRNGQTVDFYYDDLAISDSAYPGAGGILPMLPTGDGAYTAWIIGVGTGSNWQLVDENPPDGDTTYLLSTGVSGDAETVTLQSAATAGITGTVNAVKAIAVVKRNLTVYQCLIRLRSGSTDSDLNGNQTTSPIYKAKAAIYETDPATSAAWSLSALNSIQVGVVENVTNATRLTRLTSLLAMVDSSPPTLTNAQRQAGFFMS